MEQLNWELMRALPIRDLWLTLMEFIPLDTIIADELYKVNQASYAIFSRRYPASKPLRAHKFIIKYDPFDNNNKFDGTMEDLIMLVRNRTPRWKRVGDLVQFKVRSRDSQLYNNDITLVWTGNGLTYFSNGMIFSGHYWEDDFPSIAWYSDICTNCKIYLNCTDYKTLSKIMLISPNHHLYKIQHKRSGRILFMFTDFDKFKNANALNYFDYGTVPQHKLPFGILPPSNTIWPLCEQHGATMDNFIYMIEEDEIPL